MNRRIITFLTVMIWVCIFVAGLWPFNFIPKNRIHWLLDGAGLLFDDYGQVYSSAPLVLPRGPDGVAEVTIEMAFTPSKSYQDSSAVFSLVNQDKVVFAIGQSLTDLFLQGSFRRSRDKPISKLWIDDACDNARELFLTVTLDSRHVDLYLDGHLARSFPVSTQAGNVSGKLLVGHSVKGGQWSGSVARLAILDGTLDAADISRRYAQWTATRHLDKDVNHRAAAYDFVTPAKGFVRNVGETGPDLIIPKTFRLLRSTVLEWPDHLNRSVAVDAVVNIAGFVPFGVVTFLCLRFWTGWSISRCVAMTILVGSSISLAVELLQVLLPTRDSSLADLITNILGTAIGAGGAVVDNSVRIAGPPLFGSREWNGR